MRETIVVAVDGPAGSGKSSVSREVAVDLGLQYIDSGALYRAVTWFFLRDYEELTPEIDYRERLNEIHITQEFLPDGTSRTMVNSEDVSAMIRNERITANIGVVSDNVDVRNFINEQLRSWSRDRSIIMDGRDIGTVVFPEADIKLYLDASVEVRAERRMKEYREMGKNVDEKSIKNQIIQRDEQDTSRPFGRLIRAEDALHIDTTGMSKQDVIDRIGGIVTQYLESSTGKDVRR